ncbi:MAG: choice-of-anchor L domain-containing protein [Chitinophagales bacterium]|nr:choice-of-anchor L domain-containing protein [Bacteroidota bacterium]
MKKTLLLPLFVLPLAFNAGAQLVVTDEPNDTTFIYSLAGPGIVVSNIERTCADGASGFFDATSANVGIDNGIALTSGTLLNTLGPNNMGSASGYNGTLGDADLDAVTIWTTYDACIIEFDMDVAADTLKLQYVFGSEEYAEFVGSGFNDVFAFWVSGPDILTPVNIAVVPGTDIPVTINNINDATNPEYYLYNGDGFSDPYASDVAYVQYDGLTTVLLATIPVTAGGTYHMKMAVADAGDGILDSGVFLETGSLGSLRMQHQTLADNDLTYAVEKCANGYFKITNEVPCAEPLVIDYYIAGSATNGVDYELIPNQLTIPAFESEGIIEIIPLHDAVAESFESVELYLYNPQSGFVYDTLSLLIDDEPAPASFTSAEDELTISFTETSGVAESVSWDFGDGNTSNELNPVHTYAVAGLYEVCLSIVNVYGCDDITCQTTEVGVDLAVNDLDNNITISPNPANEFIQVAFTTPLSGNVVIQVKNIVGEVVNTTSAASSNTTINISNLAAGIYFVEINNNGTIVSQKIEKL